MFRAWDQDRDSDLVSLSVRRGEMEEEVRERGHSGFLLCPHCREPVRLRYGKINRPHFAHKDLSDCPLSKESPQRLAARAILFDWLEQQTGRTPQIEKSLEPFGYSGMIDLWVENTVDGTTRSFGYLVCAGKLGEYDREQLRLLDDQQDIYINTVFPKDRLRLRDIDTVNPVFKLTPTERDLIMGSIYDEVYDIPHRFAQSVHYLDHETSSLTTMRRSLIYDGCQWFTGRQVDSELARVGWDSVTGEFVHPGEADRLQAIQAEKEERARLEKERHKRMMAQREKQRQEQEERQAMEKAEQERLRELAAAEDPVLKCVLCGEMTNSYWWDHKIKGVCKCRECLRSGRS